MSDLPGEDRESVPILLSRVTREPPSSPRAPRSAKTPPLAGVDWMDPGARARRFGRFGLLVAALLLVLAAVADFLASDLPVLGRAQGTLYVLPNVTHPAGLDEHTAWEWKISAVVAHGPRSPSAERLAPPRSGHPFGTDRDGRDVFARTMHGTRSYILFAIGAVLVASVFGGLAGGAAGLFGGALDAAVTRVVESVSAFPPLVLVIGIQAAVPRATLLTLFLAIALTRWPETARLVRGEVLLASTRDYVLAARALGASKLRILGRHIAPNVVGRLGVAAGADVGTVVLTEASLDFLRIGTPPGAASWGETMSQFRDAASAWWLLAFPGAFLVVTIVSWSLMGEAARDALDPRSRA